MIPQIHTANSKRLLSAETEGGEEVHMHSPRPALCYSDTSAVAGFQPAVVMISASQRWGTAFPRWCKGKSWGQIPPPPHPPLYSPSSHLRLGEAGSARGCALTALPGRGTPTCVNPADRFTAWQIYKAPAWLRALLEVPGQSQRRGATPCCVTTPSAAWGRGTSSLARRCQVRSALQPALLLGWAFSEGIPNSSLNLAC